MSLWKSLLSPSPGRQTRVSSPANAAALRIQSERGCTSVDEEGSAYDAGYANTDIKAPLESPELLPRNRILAPGSARAWTPSHRSYDPQWLKSDAAAPASGPCQSPVTVAGPPRNCSLYRHPAPKQAVQQADSRTVFQNFRGPVIL